MVISHSTPLSPALEVPLAIAGWLPLVAGVVITNVRAKRSPRLKPSSALALHLAAVRRRTDIYLFGAVMLVIVVAAVTEAFQGNRSGPCDSGNPATCIKIDQWSEKDGSFFRRFPYDAGGADYPNAPWVQISRTEYVAEVGTRLRSAAGFGVLALTLASFMSVVEEGMWVTRSRPRKGEIKLADDLPHSSGL